ncbi:hypothetical protein BDM02DRAFT_3257839 [Thelephora ganbajun]|uniref:Uncharacterized protein n=1 Tax=Thelephora ganbajun TaxID=370292 RepID=A0ACB6ZUY2_THEGA|nr:hypothetical protein BDM02DRAFT_3257839 [Thelephora ganbajun]
MLSTSSPNPSCLEMSSSPGYFPMQCDRCGRELINMGCNKCSPPERFISPLDMQPTAGSPTRIARLEAHLAQRRREKNSGGFPKFSQLSLVIPLPINVGKHRSPRKMAFTSTVSHSLVQFRGFNGSLLKLSDGVSITDPSIVNGHHKPFARRVTEGQAFTVLTKFERHDGLIFLVGIPQMGNQIFPITRAPQKRHFSDAFAFISHGSLRPWKSAATQQCVYVVVLGVPSHRRTSRSSVMSSSTLTTRSQLL